MRGFAIAMMFVFHFSFDLSFFGVVQIAFLEDPFWINFRRFIVSSFLFIAGISLYLASRHGINRNRFLRRLALLFVYSALVSLGSWFMFPATFIYFGILHFIFVASLLGLFFTRLYWMNLVLGVAVIAADYFFSFAAFDHIALQWIGFVTELPYTEDFVPIFPWFGFVLLGMFTGRALLGTEKPIGLVTWQGNDPVSRLLAFGGRHSIHIYLLHQPIFIGILSAFFWLFPRT